MLSQKSGLRILINSYIIRDTNRTKSKSYFFLELNSIATEKTMQEKTQINFFV